MYFTLNVPVGKHNQSFCLIQDCLMFKNILTSSNSYKRLNTVQIFNNYVYNICFTL